MCNEHLSTKFEENDLILLLIQHVKVNKVVFPIEKVKYLSNEEVIKTLKDCVSSQTRYISRYNIKYEKIIFPGKLNTNKIVCFNLDEFWKSKLVEDLTKVELE